MAEWPTVDEVKQVLDITSDDWEDTVERITAAAIAKVKLDVGGWDEYEDEPDDTLAQAALRMAGLIAARPGPVIGSAGGRRLVIDDPTYLRLLSGHRRAFGVA